MQLKKSSDEHYEQSRSTRVCCCFCANQCYKNSLKPLIFKHFDDIVPHKIYFVNKQLPIA